MTESRHSRSRDSRSQLHRDPVASESADFDLIIVGGGIQGICLTLEASRRGLRALLLEQNDFGSATSGNSLRILHGGLRYLQSLDLRRYFASVAERRWFTRQFPDLVRPLPCLMPLYGHGMRRPSTFRLALALNDLLSSSRNRGVASACQLPGGKLLSRRRTAEIFPQVDPEGLLGGGVWHDAMMTNPEHLLIELLRWACACGARALEHVQARRLLTSGERTTGLEAVDCESGSLLRFSAPIVVNCAGPWSGQLARALGSPVPDLFHPSLAFNLLLDREPISEMAVAVSPDAKGRTYFLVPASGKLLAGTYHAPWHGKNTAAHPTKAQVQEMLDDLNRSVRGLRLRHDEVSRVFAGLLPATAPGSAGTTTRDRIVDHQQQGGPKGLYSVSGVKFTTARLLAEKALRRIYSGTGMDLQLRWGTERPTEPGKLDPQSIEPTSWSESVGGESALHLDVYSADR